MRTTATRLSLLASLLVLGTWVLTGAAAGAARSTPVVYDALGDSYASGYGVPPYTGGGCARSAFAPAELIDGRKQIQLDDFAACAGAKTSDIPAQLGALNAGTDLVTLSIGGNDIFWSRAVMACILYDQSTCETAINATRAAVIGALPQLLDATYASISAAAPNAHVVITGYARLFSPAYGDYATPLGTVTTDEQQLLNSGADLLNSTIAGVAARHGFQFVDVTARFDDHGVNASEPWLGGLLSPGPFHPNLQGYKAYAAALTASINPTTLP